LVVVTLLFVQVTTGEEEGKKPLRISPVAWISRAAIVSVTQKPSNTVPEAFL
jgi:hypothetical protein